MFNYRLLQIFVIHYLHTYCVVIGGIQENISSDVCKVGVRCVVLSECSELHRQWVADKNATLVLVRQLLCGFRDDGKPKVCCPQALQTKQISTAPSPANRQKVTFRSAVVGPAILPNTSVCGIQNNDRIFGGNQTGVDEHPWMALIRYEKSNSNHSGFFCGGVLISSRHVLTAGHCINGKNVPLKYIPTKVRLGEWDITSETDCYKEDCIPPAYDVPIEKIYVHELYYGSDVNQLNDIAVLKLSKEVTITDYVRPICLPTNNLLQNNFEDHILEVVGWGQIENGSTSAVKLKVRMSVPKLKECQEKFKRVHLSVTDRQLCIGGDGRSDSCIGDSGGPAMGQFSDQEQWTVIGVVSYGPSPCASLGWPGIYTRVTTYMDWIMSKIAL